MSNINQIIELESFIVTSNSVLITGDDLSDINRAMTNVLPGNYRVFKHTYHEEQTRSGNLFIVHDNIYKQNLSLEQYGWINGGTYDMQNYPVKILDTHTCTDINHLHLSEQLADNMAQVVDNIICFSHLYEDEGYQFNILQHESNTVGFNIMGIESWIDTPQSLFEKACRHGNLEKVKYFLHSPEVETHAQIRENNYEGYYSACFRGHKKLIQYFLTNSELIEKCHIYTRNYEPFITFCNSSWDLAYSLIIELPMESIYEIKDLLDRPNKLINWQEINKLVSLKILYEKLDNDIEKQPDFKKLLKI